MGKVRLKDIDCFISDGNYSSKYPRSGEFVKEGIPFIRCNNFKNNTITKEDMYYITKEKHSILQKGHLRQGDILITTRGSLGQVVIVPKEYEDANINAQIVLLRVNKEKIYNRYLMWQLKSENIQNQIMKNKTGTALPQLPISKLEKIELFIVDNIQEQIEIATKLDRIQEIIDIRKKQIEELDELIKSQFVEMFEKEKNEEILNNICKFINGDRGKNYPSSGEFVESGIPFINAGLIKEKKVNWKEMNYITEEKYNKLGSGKIQKDDVLYCLRGSLGKHCIIDVERKGAIASSLVILRANKEKILPEYLLNILDTDEIIMQQEQANNGSSQPNLSAGSVKKYKIKLPNIKRQEEFVNIVKQIDKQKFEIQKNLEEMQKLQESLMNKYFG